VRLPRALSVAILVPLISLPASAAVFQYALEFTSSKGKTARAHLWIPPDADRVRGVVACGTTLMEREFAKDAQIRDACRDQNIALVILSCGLGQAGLPELLEQLAVMSGYRELARAPLCFVGHSAGGPQAMTLAQKMADRCFGLIQYRGGMPTGENPVAPGIPALVMLGQFDEFGGTMRDESGTETWEDGANRLAGFRSLGPDRLGSLLVEPGAGHFAWSERNAAYVSLFLRKAAASIIPAAGDGRKVRLSRPDPRGGWLTTISPKGRVECAPFADYEGDPGRTSWHFDEEMARATLRYHRGLVGRKDQFIAWKNRFWVDAGARFFFLDLDWQADGCSFTVEPEYAAVYPSRHKGQGPRWARAGTSCGNGGTEILVRTVGGPLELAGSRSLRIAFDALVPAGGSVRGTFMAYSRGNDEYRHTEQVGMLSRGFKGATKGRDQRIVFPELRDLRADAEPVTLAATSDADLPVSYYVARGPAVIDRGRLVLREIPRRARFPIEVEVVAWQFGRCLGPLVKTADPVSRTFRVTTP
jgi:hypothetical protein